MAELAYLIRHGDYEHRDEKLTPQGIEQSESAREELIARELGGRAYLLSSDAPRALQTATVICRGLDVPILLSPQVRRGSMHSDAVGILGEFLQHSLLEDADEEAEPGKPFIVVCHAPLVAAFTGHKVPNDVEKGRVYEVDMAASNPDYDTGIAEFVLSGGLES